MATKTEVLVKWKGIEAYLCDDSRWGERKYTWTIKKSDATRFRNENEAQNAYRDSGAGDESHLELIEG